MTGFITDGQTPEDSVPGAELGYETETPVGLEQGFGEQSLFSGGTVSGSLMRFGQRDNAQDKAVDLAENKMSADQVNKSFAPVGPDGKQAKITDQPMYPEVARVVAKAKGDELDRQGIISRFQNQHGLATNLAVGTAAFMSDPLNAASLFVPGVGEETSLAAAARIGLSGTAAKVGARVIAGATGAAAGQVPLVAAQYGLGQQEASDYSLRDAFKDLAFNAGIGAVLHAGLGATGDAWKARTMRPDIALVPGATTTADAAKIMDAPAPTTHAAISTSVAQMAEGREVNVDPFFPKPNESQTLADLAQKQQEVYKEGFQPGMTSGHLKEATDDLLGSEEAEKIEGQKPSAQERPEATPAQGEAAPEQEGALPTETLYRGVKTEEQASDNGVTFLSPEKEYAGKYGDIVKSFNRQGGKELDLTSLGSVADHSDVARLLEKEIGPEPAENIYSKMDVGGDNKVDVYKMLRDKESVDELKKAGIDFVRYHQLGDGADKASVGVLNPAILKSAETSPALGAKEQLSTQGKNVRALQKQLREFPKPKTAEEKSHLASIKNNLDIENTKYKKMQDEAGIKRGNQGNLQRRPQSAVGWLVKNGGLKPSADLNAIKAHKIKGLVRNGGMSDEEAIAGLQQEGFLPKENPNRPAAATMNDIHEIIEKHQRDAPTYREKDAGYLKERPHDAQEDAYHRDADIHNETEDAKEFGYKLNDEEALYVHSLREAGYTLREALDEAIEKKESGGLQGERASTLPENEPHGADAENARPAGAGEGRAGAGERGPGAPGGEPEAAAERPAEERGRAGVAGGGRGAEGTAGAAGAGVKPSPLDQEISALEAKIDTSKYTAEELADLHAADQKIREAELWKKGYQALADCLKGV